MIVFPAASERDDIISEYNFDKFKCNLFYHILCGRSLLIYAFMDKYFDFNKSKVMLAHYYFS